MVQTISVARSFTYVSPAGRFELGIAQYPGMEDAFATDPYVVAHLEAAVVAAGRPLLQWRQLKALDPVSGIYVPSMFYAPVVLVPAFNGHIYTQSIEPGWVPIFMQLERTYPLDDPNDDYDIPSGAGRAYRDWRPRHRQETLHAVRQLMPGDPSPPVSRSDPPWQRRVKSFPLPPGFPVSMLSRPKDGVPVFAPDVPVTVPMPQPDRSAETERELPRHWIAAPLNTTAWPSLKPYDRASERDPLLPRRAAA